MVARAGEACAAADHLRQRIRLLTRLNRLTEANPVEVIGEKGSSANIELIGILRGLAGAVRREREFRSEASESMKQSPLDDAMEIQELRLGVL
jgi:hypothetical protein